MNWVASCPTQSHHCWWVGKRSWVALQSTTYSALQCITVHYWVALQCTTSHRDQVNPGFGATWSSPILQSRPAKIFLLTIIYYLVSHTIPLSYTITSPIPSHHFPNTDARYGPCALELPCLLTLFYFFSPFFIASYFPYVLLRNLKRLEKYS